MIRTVAARIVLTLSALLAGCAPFGTPEAPAEELDDLDAERSLVMTWEVPIPGRTRVELWLRAGSVDGEEPLAAAVMAEVWASRAEAEPWVTPSLVVLSMEVPSDELTVRTERLFGALAAPPEREEIERAVADLEAMRRRQSRSPEREAIAAAFDAASLPSALPLGEEGDGAPSRAALESFTRAAVNRDRLRALFIGAIPRGLSRRVERAIRELGPATEPRRDPHQGEPTPLTLREAEPAWALVARLTSLPLAAEIERALGAGALSATDATIALAPSRLGAFLVISGRGEATPEQIRAAVLETRRLASWSGSLERAQPSDLRQRAREEALRYSSGSAGHEAEPTFYLGLAVRDAGEIDRGPLEAALAARVDPAPVHASPEGEGTTVVARLPALFSGEPASEAGRGALLLRALTEGCTRLGLRVRASSQSGDGLIHVAFDEAPRLRAVQTLARCLLRESPRSLTWESVRAALLDELSRDPLQPALEAIAAALYPASPSSALPLHTRALRHRSGDGRLTDALSTRRKRGMIDFSVHGAGHEAVAAQLGALVGSLPETSKAPVALRSGRPIVGPVVVSVDAPSVFLAAARLDQPSSDAALAFASRWARRAQAAGLPIIRALSGGHAHEGHAILVVPMGGSDPETLRRALEGAAPDEDELEEALGELARERAYRRQLGLDEPAAERAPRVVGWAYAIGAERE